MKPFLRLAPLFAASATLLPLCASAAPAEAPPVKLTIDNQQKLVTVKDADGRPLFSTVMATPNLTANVTQPATDHLLLALRDASGKTLWTKPLGPLKGNSLKANWTGSGFTIGLEKSASSVSATDEADPIQSMLIVLGPDDKFLSMTGQSKKRAVSVLPQKDGIVLTATADGETTHAGVQFSESKGEGVFTLGGKKYPLRKVQRNGKTYTDLDWNGKHVLLPSDSQFTIDTTEDGLDELIIDAPTASSQAAPAAPAK